MIDQTCSVDIRISILQGSAVTKWRWGGRRNLTFMRNKFRVLTMKKWLKLI